MCECVSCVSVWYKGCMTEQQLCRHDYSPMYKRFKNKPRQEVESVDIRIFSPHLFYETDSFNILFIMHAYIFRVKQQCTIVGVPVWVCERAVMGFRHSWVAKEYWH